ncbi:hypothetical protein N7455_012532 [Penicillium solitum]|uniref:uncharacterized protein n=1 Tax=Penicillium solitum TaxID=60172 RepID=UPI0032C4A713|nr:hypothetical protein N7455_012532 [Penicillium solitum]
MDPLSGAASVIAVIQLTGGILQICGKYLNNVKNAKKDIQLFQEKVAALSQVLHSLDELIRGSDSNKLTTTQDLIDNITKCSSVLTNLKEKINPETTQRRMRKWGLRALKWPLARSEVDFAIMELESYKTTFALSLQVDQTECLPGTRINLLREIEDRDREINNFSNSYKLSLRAAASRGQLFLSERRRGQRDSKKAFPNINRANSYRYTSNTTSIRKSTSVQLRFLLTSRPKLPIRLGFEGITDTHQDLVLYKIEKPVIEHNISLYFKDQFLRLKQRRSFPLEAVPLFITATTICRLIKSRKLLEEFKEIVGVIIILTTPLSINSLSYLINRESDNIKYRLDQLYPVLSILNSFDTPVRILHLSFRDFLLGYHKDESKFWIDKNLEKNIYKLPSEGIQRNEISDNSIQHYIPPELKYAYRY